MVCILQGDQTPVFHIMESSILRNYVSRFLPESRFSFDGGNAAQRIRGYGAIQAFSETSGVCSHEVTSWFSS